MIMGVTSYSSIVAFVFNEQSSAKRSDVSQMGNIETKRYLYGLSHHYSYNWVLYIRGVLKLQKDLRKTMSQRN